MFKTQKEQTSSVLSTYKKKKKKSGKLEMYTSPAQCFPPILNELS